MKRFVERFTSSIVSILGCFDRVIFKGYLPFYDDQHLNRFVDHGLKMRRKDFIPFVENLSDQLVEHAKKTAAGEGAFYEYLRGAHAKEKIIDDAIRQRGLSEGLIGVLCCQETCRTVKLFHAKKRPYLAYSQRPQRVLYYYFLDPEFGRIHIRLQTWFPFTIQVYVNGHEWLARQLANKRIDFLQQDNAFVQLDDAVASQKLANDFSKIAWPKILKRWAKLVNPLSQQYEFLRNKNYYWVIDQAEFSTDIVFPDKAALGELFPRLLQHALCNFSAQDILTYLGRRLHPCFDGEVLTTCRKDRHPGARIKHRVKNNWLKMYDKFGQILRIETVINQPREFRVRRRRTRQGHVQMVWCPMNKGVSNFYHYHAVARRANEHYLDALATVAMPCATAKQLDQLSKPAPAKAGRRRRPLNLLAAEEQKLFLAVLRGDHHLNGFRNRDVARHLYATPAKDAATQWRRTQQVCRKLQLLRAHGLIAKIPRSQRYRITTKGEALMNSAIYVRHKAFPKELQEVA